MHPTIPYRFLASAFGLLAFTAATFAQATNPAPARGASGATNLGPDAQGNPLRRATKTGHVSNYDEAKVGSYTLPDPLVLANGKPVRDADTWFKQRRPEILKLYETEIYGRVPANAPKVTWEVTTTDTNALDGTAVMKRVAGHIGDRPDGPRMNVTMYTPAKATGPVPIILCISFGFGAGGPRGNRGAGAGAAGAGAAAAPGATNAPAPGRGALGGRGGGGFGDPIDLIIARGCGYATVNYGDIQPDRANAFTNGVIGLTLSPGQTAPEPDRWGTISAWAWGISRIIDYFETDKTVDAKRVAIQGHSRLGKTVLWAGAQDPRIAVVFSSCSGEMGAALARRDYGETVDDMAQNYPWQFAGNFQKWVGHWNDMPVDSHMLIALNAPHGLFINGGTTDQWSDPKGEFLGAVAAGPVYRLVGRKDLGTTELPALDTPLISGDLGWVYHTGGHAATRADWIAFLDFAEKYFKPQAAVGSKP
jgi:hypothetical protein